MKKRYLRFYKLSIDGSNEALQTFHGFLIILFPLSSPEAVVKYIDTEGYTEHSFTPFKKHALAGFLTLKCITPIGIHLRMLDISVVFRASLFKTNEQMSHI